MPACLCVCPPYPRCWALLVSQARCEAYGTRLLLCGRARHSSKEPAGLGYAPERSLQLVAPGTEACLACACCPIAALGLSNCLRDRRLQAAGYCALAGCDCLPTWTYTSSTTGQTYNITNGTCQNPGGDWSTDWCYVNPLSCAHRPFLANGPTVTQAWDTCTAPNLNKTIDSGACPSPRQMAVMGVVWSTVRAVLCLVHPCTSARPALSDRAKVLSLGSGFLRRQNVRHGSACPRVYATRCHAPQRRARVLSASQRRARKCLAARTDGPPGGTRARREDAQLLQLHEQLRGRHAQRHHPGHQRRVHPGRPLAPALVLRGQGHLLCPAARAQRLRVGLLSRCAPVFLL